MTSWVEEAGAGVESTVPDQPLASAVVLSRTVADAPDVRGSPNARC